MSDFNATVRTEEGISVIDLHGTIDAFAESGIESAYEVTRQVDARAVALDFNAVDYINSTGIALLVSLLAKAKRDGRPVRAWGLTDHYREIFEITRLADFLEVFADEDSARAASEPA